MNKFILDHLSILKANNFIFPEIELRALLNKTSKRYIWHIDRGIRVFATLNFIVLIGVIEYV